MHFLILSVVAVLAALANVSNASVIRERQGRCDTANLEILGPVLNLEKVDCLKKIGSHEYCKDCDWPSSNNSPNGSSDDDNSSNGDNSSDNSSNGDNSSDDDGSSNDDDSSQ
ncbi:hypothetical protein V8E54_011980 [Elaphomyces granulatus]